MKQIQIFNVLLSTTRMGFNFIITFRYHFITLSNNINWSAGTIHVFINQHHRIRM